MRRALYAGLAAFITIVVVSHFRSSPYNNYVLLADAFLHGHVWVTVPGNYIDALAYNGRNYVIEAPMPAMLLLPAVVVFGLHANQTLLAAVLGGVAIGAAWAICERLAVPARQTLWLCVVLLAGTDLLWCAMLGDVWFVAHVSAVCFTLLAILEVLGPRRGWLVALWATCAFESRFTMILALPVYYALLHAGPDWRVDLRALLPRKSDIMFFGVLAVAGALWSAYNDARWGTWSDIGYVTWYHQDAAGSPFGSPFALRYLPYELHSFLVLAPAFSRIFPYIVPSIAGVALTWTSPALIIAAWARTPRVLAVSFALAAAFTALPNLLYYVNGFAQYGMRHALDFIPFLFVLMALAMREELKAWVKVLIAYSTLAGLYGCYYWNAFVRPTY
ncbi:MAG: hypothetical protein DLM50_04695 [Candidatus Meridianibacter frigidus]|nr:MAG: hypothetical protein DLM50_04695 [Candidatus Eremiobacteraeota bacterium]